MLCARARDLIRCITSTQRWQHDWPWISAVHNLLFITVTGAVGALRELPESRRRAGGTEGGLGTRWFSMCANNKHTEATASCANHARGPVSDDDVEAGRPGVSCAETFMPGIHWA